MGGAVAARLHVILAREARTAVVFRRGPARHTAVMEWNLAKDGFTLGQWFYGRIYERRCDLSPNGKRLLYFAMNGRWRSETKGSWTAISNAPYLQAVALFAKGDGWHGGGLFHTNWEFWLNGAYGHTPLREHPGLTRVAAFPWHETYGGECPGVYYIRLQRDGWAMGETAAQNGGRVAVFEKPIAGDWVLRKYAHETAGPPIGRGCYYDAHELANRRTGETAPKPDWEWADMDRRRLVWAAGGKLFAASVTRDGVGPERELFDFNPMRFERIAAPY